MRCPACSTTNPSTQRFCGGCGAVLAGPESETVITSGLTPQRFAGDSARFVPGQVIAGRYRMVGLLGKGGMGEVYRADDLKLGQPVALKFLPRDVEADSDRLSRFLTEVRLSLKVTHPNVCRVFGVEELDGRHFLSMEYVDGEDLESLLRRIGRLPEDKAIEIARQLCAGLAAAHDEGVLHRDLKPANVMIDGRGRAKITDFGLAGATAGIAGREAQAGTPQYMAPEQFDGRELSVQTDIYSLGLVLYELFTGKRAFEGRTLQELKEMHSSAPTSPSVHVSTLDPHVERAILRCVDPDPARRPKSAASLAAALPGGDPVEMAIAAGETPSPEMVARSGGGGELKPSLAVAALATVLVGLALIWVYGGRTAIWNRIPLPKPPAELRLAARAALASAGYTAKPGGSVFGFDKDDEYFDKVRKDDQSPGRWQNLSTVEPVPLRFWYRESPIPLAPFNNAGTVEWTNPPFNQAGMAGVHLDPSGRLQTMRVVPADLPESPGPWPEPDWSPLFGAAAYTMADWSAAEPLWTPPVSSDVRRAWTKGTLRIEAASLRGKPVMFNVIPGWRQSATQATVALTPLRAVARTVINVLVMIAAIVLARRHIRQGRSDLRGATRFALVLFGLGAAIVYLRFTGDLAAWIDGSPQNLGPELYQAAQSWIFYVAIEPYVRRLWPGTLVAWSRALEGRLRDPLIGRHILFGAIAGLFISLLEALPTIVRSGTSAPPPPSGIVEVLASTSAYLGETLDSLQVSFLLPVAILLLVLMFRAIFRRPWLAYAAFLALLTTGFTSLGASSWLEVVGVLALFTTALVVVTRLGLFALLVCILFSAWPGFTLTLDSSSWFFTQSVVTMACFVSVAAYGFWISLGGQKVFTKPLLEA